MSNLDLERAEAIFAARVPGSICRLVDGEARIRCTVGSRGRVAVTFPSTSSDLEMRRQAESLDVLSS
jgi:hypothetical protein